MLGVHSPHAVFAELALRCLRWEPDPNNRAQLDAGAGASLPTSPAAANAQAEQLT